MQKRKSFTTTKRKRREMKKEKARNIQVRSIKKERGPQYKREKVKRLRMKHGDVPFMI